MSRVVLCSILLILTPLVKGACIDREKKIFRLVKNKWGLGKSFNNLKQSLPKNFIVKSKKSISFQVNGNIHGLIFSKSTKENGLAIEYLSPHYSYNTCSLVNLKKTIKDWGRRPDVETKLKNNKLAYSWVCKSNEINMRYTIRDVLDKSSKKWKCTESWAIIQGLRNHE